MEIRLNSTCLELLFLCLCLLTGKTLGQATGATVVKVAEGSDAVLPCSIRPEKNIKGDLFDWRKVVQGDDNQEVFMYKAGRHYNNDLKGQDEQFKGRVFHFPDQLQFGNASMVIRDTKQSDSGTYTCDYSPDKPNRQTFYIKLDVEAVVTVSEWNEAVLPCSIRPEKNITQDVFHWKKGGQNVFFYERGKHFNNGLPDQDPQFKGRVSHFPDQLQFGDASIVIRDTKPSDSGTYTCDYSPDEEYGQTFYIKLDVCDTIRDRSRDNIPGASREPSVTLLYHREDEAQLQCEVRGVSPKPKVELQDISGNILLAEEPQVTERGGSYDIILKTTVKEAGNFTCVVTQEKICHRISAVAFVHVYESPTGWIVGVVVLSIILGVVVAAEAVLYKMGRIKLNCKKGGGPVI